MNKFKIIYSGIGIGLIIAASLLATRGLPEDDRLLYDKASKISANTIEQIWPGLEFNNYPMAIRTGNKEFIIKNGVATSRKPVLPIIAATAYRVDEEINIFMPSIADMSALGTMVEGITSSQEMMFVKGFSMTQNSLTDEQYIGIMYHEALHAHQIDYHERVLFQNIPEDFNEYDILDLILTIDDIAPLKQMYNKELDLLLAAVINPDDHLDDYISARQERTQMLNDYFGSDDIKKIIYLENYYEKVEGTARYLEANVILTLGNEALYDEYMDNIQHYFTGKEKYYRSGMGLSLILDKLTEDWKSEVFIKSESMFEKIERYASIKEE